MTIDDLKGTSWAFPWMIEGEFMSPGMTLRDWFAGQALAGWMSSFTPDCGVKAKNCAELAYELADAMLAARNNNTENK